MSVDKFQVTHKQYQIRVKGLEWMMVYTSRMVVHYYRCTSMNVDDSKSQTLKTLLDGEL